MTHSDNPDTEEDLAIEEKIRKHYATVNPSAQLYERIQRGVKSETLPRYSRRTWATVALCASILMVAVLVMLPVSKQTTQVSGDSLAAILINELHTYSISGRHLDVINSDPIGVQDWFKTRVAFYPPRPVTNPPHLTLAGGRLCNIKNRRVVSYMYDDNGTPISLYILDNTKNPALTETPRHGLHGYNYVAWTHSGLRFSLVGPVRETRLNEIAQSLQAKL